MPLSILKSVMCKPKLNKANCKVFANGSNKSLKFITAPVYVVKRQYGNLFSYATSVDLCGKVQ